PLNNLMEDAATAEISRAQLWQWTHHATGILDEGRNVSPAWFKKLLGEEMARIEDRLGEDAFGSGHYPRAAKLLEQITLADKFLSFLTTVAYDELD
ncbi:MAG: malate synthase A, partial [Gammaproteobacteria bacterium]|nr:malate synthase A [Gammaproteobacteria bacterium]